MASFSEALDAQVTTKGPQCTVCKLLADENVSARDRASIQAALESDRQQSHIARALAAFTGEGLWAGRGQTVGKHRQQHM